MEAVGELLIEFPLRILVVSAQNQVRLDPKRDIRNPVPEI